MRVARGGHRGLLVSGYTKIGVWGVLRGPRQLVSVRRSPALHLTLNRGVTGDRFDEIVLSHPDAARLTQRIRQAVRARQPSVIHRNARTTLSPKTGGE